MANDKEVMKYALLTGIGALFTTKLLGWISKWLSTGGYVDVDLQSVATVKTQGLSTVINPGLNVYVGKLLDVANIQFTFPEWSLLFIGGALFGVLGYSFVKMLGGMSIKSSTVRTTLVFVVASVATSALIAWKLDVPTMASLIPLVINSIILAFGSTVILMFAGVEKNI